MIPTLLAFSLGLALVVFLATLAMDFLYVLYTASVVAGRRVAAATFSMIWHLTTALVIVVYTKSIVYLAFVGMGSWIGSYFGMGWSNRKQAQAAQVAAEPLRIAAPAKALAAPASHSRLPKFASRRDRSTV